MSSLILTGTEPKRIYGLGSNKKSQLDVLHHLPGKPEYRVIDVGSTWNSSFLLLECSSNEKEKEKATNEGGEVCVIASGSNSHGQLGGFGRELSHDIVEVTQEARPESIMTLRKAFWSACLNSGEDKISNLFDQPSIKLKVEKLVCGSEHVFILLSVDDKTSSPDVDSTIQSQPQQVLIGWGWNEHGNLGLGHTNDAIDGPVVIPFPKVKDGSSAPVGLGRVDCESPRENSQSCKIEGVWAGCGTSWLAVRYHD